MKVDASLNNGAARITINGVLHLWFRPADLRGIQTWETVGRDWCLELTLKDAVIVAEYDTLKQLAAILDSIEGLGQKRKGKR